MESRLRTLRMEVKLLRQGKGWAEERAMKAETALRVARAERPEIVCLCGSTRFYQEYQRANYEHSMAGRIVLSVGFYMHSPNAAHGETLGCTPEQKIAQDELHFRKIELADFVYVVNVGGYIGESTRNEINHAAGLGKRVEYLEPIESERSE